MSEPLQTTPPAAVNRPTFAQVEARQEFETKTGIPVRVYMSDPNPDLSDTPLLDPAYLGTVGMYRDPKGCADKLFQLKARKPKSHFFTEKELYLLSREAEKGTIWRWIQDWRETDGTPMENTSVNLSRILDINFIYDQLNEQYKRDADWQKAAEEEMKGNSPKS